MTDKPQNIEIQVEANAVEATRAASAVAKELAQVVSQVGALETKLKGIFSGQLPKELEAAKGYLKTLQNAANISRTLATGGPATQLNSAAFRGEVAKLQTDKVVQTLRYEKELNKVLEARAEIYGRIRKTLPEGASERSTVKAYRDTLRMVGAAPGDGATQAERRAFTTSTLNEARSFEEKLNGIHVAAMEKQNVQARVGFAKAEQIRKASQEAEIQQLITFAEKREAVRVKADERALARQTKQNLDAQAAMAISNAKADEQLKARQTKQNLDAQAAMAISNAKAQVAQDKLAAKPAPKTHEQHVGSSLQNIKDRFNYQGGAGMLTVQTDIMRNYAVMGSVLGTLGFAAKSTIEFETAMKNVQAISRATDGEIKLLQKTIFEVGQTTKFSAKELSEGVTILAQAGLSVQQIGEAIKPISQLATAAGTSIADAASTTTSVLGIFDMALSRTADVSNTMVAGLNQSKLGMEQLSLGIQYAGNIAADGGVQFEELVAAMGAMSNAGIKSGSTLGTGMRSLIADLENPSKKFTAALREMGLTTSDVDIRINGLGKVMETLSAKGFDSAKAMGAFELRAAAAYSALSNNIDFYHQMEEAIVGTTAASDAAAIQMDSFSAQWSRLKNSVTEVSVEMAGPFMGALGGVIGGLATLMHSTSAAGPAIALVGTLLASLATAATINYLAKLALGFLSMTAVVGPSTFAMAGMALAQGNVIAATKLLTITLRTAAVAFLATPVGMLSLAITALTVVLGGAAYMQGRLTAEIQGFTEAANTANAKAADYQSRVKELDKYVEFLSDRHVVLGGNIDATMDKAIQKFGDWGFSIRGRIADINDLIGRVIDFRQEMSRAALEQAEIEKGAILARSGAEAKTSATAQGGFSQREALEGKLPQSSQAALATLRRSDVSYREFASAQATLKADAKKLPAGRERKLLDRLIPQTERLRAPLAAQAQTARQLSAVNTTIATGTVVSSPAVGNFMKNSERVVGAWQRQEAAIRKKYASDPQKMAAELSAFYDQRTATANTFRMSAQQIASDALNADPDLQLSYQSRVNNAAPGTLTQDIMVQDMMRQGAGPKISLAAGGRAAPGADPKLLKTEAKTETEIAALRKKQKRLTGPDSYESHMLRAKQLLGDANVDPDRDPETNLAYAGESNELMDARIARGLIPSGGGGGRSTVKAQGAAEVKALERQIEQMVGQAGPDAAGIAAAGPKLKVLLEQWKAAKRQANPDGDLEDFNIQSQEYIDKILSGNVQAAKDWLAKRALDDAGNTTQDVAAKLRDGAMSIEDGLKEINTGFLSAANKAVEASNEELKAKYGADFDPSTSAEAIQKNLDITRGIVATSLEAANTALAAVAERQAAAYDQLELGLGAREAKISAMSNSYGKRNVSDVQRYLGSVEGEKIAVERQRNLVGKAADDYDNQLINIDNLTAKLAADPRSEALKTQLAEAEVEARKLEMALNLSRQSLDAMTAQTPTLSSATEAIAASWQAYADQAGLTKPMFEQLADGMTGVFENARGSFKTLVTDVLTGSKSMGTAMKDFTLSVLQSFVDMAAQMLANAALQWVMETVASAFMGGMSGGGGAKTTNTINSKKQGGEILRRAQGGITPAHNRDSVHTLTEPGEVVMSRTAVDFIGKEELLTMNRNGNRRMSEMPSILPQKREPDQVNVWVVAPETKPTMGKNDVLAVIGNDIMTGGTMKQLIKAVQVGAA